MSTKKILLIALFSLMVVQADAAGILLGPQFGYYQAQDADKGSLTGGLTCRLKFTPVIGAEASINYRQEKYLDDAVTVRSWPLMVTGLLYPVPFVYGAIGMGWYNVTYDFNQDKLPLFTDDTMQEFGWHFGAGVEIPVAPKCTLTGDIRYVFLDYDFDDIPGGSDLKSDFFVITVGALFAL